MNIMFVTASNDTQSMSSPSTREELDRLKLHYSRDNGYTVISEIDTTNDRRLDPMIIVIMAKRVRR